MTGLGSTLRTFSPAPNVLAFYDGRIPGVRAWSAEPNWLDDGAYELGICSYAIVDGSHALVYDTHISISHARLIRSELERRGVREMRVVLSHWHDDHIAGNEVFADAEILAHRLTADLLASHRERLESANPPINPLVMPNRTWEGEALELTVGGLRVELRHADIHSRDGVVLLLPDAGLMLAGDTLEDSVTFVDEPDRLGIHLEGLRKMAGWNYERILPNHGSPERIASGGYPRSLVSATESYVAKLLECPTRPDLASQDLRAFAAEEFASGALEYFAPYEAVHRGNVQAVSGAGYSSPSK